MRIIAGVTDFCIEDPTAVAIGKFDGIHLGHKRLLDNILVQRAHGLKSVVFTFDPAPSSFFTGISQPELLTREEKRDFFSEMGIDYFVEFPLTMETAAIPPEVFIAQYLYKQMNMRYISAGTDLSFGDKGRGNVDLICSFSNQLHYHVEIVDKLCHNGREISSTYVREAVDRADMQTAESLLGRPYSIKGRVVHGNRLGRTIGTPTANLVVAKEKLLPPNGVYISKTLINGRLYPGVTNIGHKPTVAEGAYGVETYLFDVDEDLYHKEIEVFLCKHTRSEKKFDNVELLRRQIEQDKCQACEYFRNLPGEFH